MRVSHLLFILGLILGARAYDYPTNCACPSWNGSFVGTATVAKITGLKIAPNTELIDGVDYGKPIFYDGKLWLGKDVKVNWQYRSPYTAECPSGYRVPTGDELRSFMSRVNTDYASDPRGFLLNTFGFSEQLVYVSSQKTFPDIIDGWNEAYAYESLLFENEKWMACTVHTYWYGQYLRSRCLLDTNTSDIKNRKWIVDEATPIYKSQKYKFDINKTNYAAAAWRVNNVVIANKQKANWTPDRAGCHVIESFLIMFGGQVIRQCKIYWAELRVGSTADTRLNIGKIKSKVFTDYTLQYSNSMHWNPQVAPIAPRADGGSYVLFATKDNFDLIVRVLDNKGVDQRTPISLQRKGSPFDIIATPWGFVALIRDKADGDILYLLGCREDGSVKFKRDIMNNGPSPVDTRNQLFFWESDGSLPFGMKAMFGPSNGRLAYIRGRISAIFGHANNFGDYYNRNCHNGDSIVTFNEDGQDERLVNSWAASHSLYVNMVPTEERVISGSLGDAFPENIVFVSAEIEPNSYVDPKTGARTRIDSIVKSDLLPGVIPGDGGGSSLGTLGSITYLGNNLLAATYQRKAGSIGWSSSDKNEVGVLFLTTNLTLIKNVYLADGTKANIVKSAKYGANLLVAIGSTPTAGNAPQRGTVPSKDTMTLMILSPSGDVLSQSTVYTPYCLTANDDFEVLADGSVVWSFIDANENLVYYRLTVETSSTFVQKKFRLKKK